jgi:hypothetical protein
VVGLDASPAMFERLAAKPGAAGVHPLLADMAEVGPAVAAEATAATAATDAPGDGGGIPTAGYRLVFCAYNTFLNLDTEQAQSRCLTGCAGLLAPDGAVVIEAYVPAPPEGLPRTSLDVARVTTDAVVLTATEHDPVAQVVTGQHVELRDGTVRLRPWRVRYLTPEQLDALAGAAGLVLSARWQDWRGTPFDDDSDTHVSVYRQASVTEH